MNAVIYARYSSLGQREQSIEDQIADCKEYAKAHGYNIIKIYADYAKTGRSDDREQFQLMLKEAEKKQFETVLVWKIDRFGRNRDEMAINRVKLKKHGVNIVSCMEYIPDDPSGVILEGVLESFAEYYSLNLSQNVKRGMNSNAQNALCNGPLPWGYKHVEDQILIDEDSASVVRLIFNLFLDGYCKADIARFLNDRQIRTSRGNLFRGTSIDKILKNRRYTGTYIYKDIEIENAFEPIITPEVFEQVQERLQLSGHKKHNVNDIYYLSEVLYCGECGSPYTSESGTGKSGKRYNYYKCSARKKDSRACSNDILKKEEFETIIFDLILNEVLRDDIIEELATRIIEAMEKDDDSILPLLIKEREDLKRKNTNLVSAIEKGISDDSIIKRIGENSTRIKELESEISREKLKRPRFSLDAVTWALKHFKAQNLKSVNSRLILVNHFINSIVYEHGYVQICFNFCYMDSNGSIREAYKCSKKTKMVRQSDVVLNTLISDSDGSLLYIFNLQDRPCAA